MMDSSTPSGNLKISRPRTANKWSLVLDLDQTLIKGRYLKQNDPDKPLTKTKELETIPGEFAAYDEFLDRIQGYGVISRPLLNEFIKVCCHNFEHIFVWSTNSAKYVDMIVGKIFEKQSKFPTSVWSFQHCKEIKGNYTKPLSKLKSSFDFIDIKTCLIVDDISNSFVETTDNGILIPEFLGDPNDKHLETLIDWIKKIPRKSRDLTVIPKPVFQLDKSKT